MLELLLSQGPNERGPNETLLSVDPRDPNTPFLNRDPNSLTYRVGFRELKSLKTN